MMTTMENCLKFNRALMVLLLTIYATQATIVPKKFNKLNLGDTITGKIGAELSVKSKLQCSDRFVFAMFAMLSSKWAK